MIERLDIESPIRKVAWRYYATETCKGNSDRIVIVSGPEKCGKTFGVVNGFSKINTVFYMSFKHNTDLQVLMRFKTLLAEREITAELSWDSCFAATNQLPLSLRPIFIFDDFDYITDTQFFEAFYTYFRAKGRAHFLFVFIGLQNYFKQTSLSFHPFYIDVEFIDFHVLRKNFISWSNADLLRLHSITNGYPALVNCFDEALPFKDNVRNIFEGKTAYISCAQSLLSGMFRETHTYYAILCAIAAGHENISSIGKATGYSYTKCNKYIKVLIEKGIVITWAVPDSAGKEKSAYRIHLGCLHFLLRYIFSNSLTELTGKIDVLFALAEFDNNFTKLKYFELCVNHFNSNSDFKGELEDFPPFTRFSTSKVPDRSFEVAIFSVWKATHIFVIHYDFDNAFNIDDLNILLNSQCFIRGELFFHIYSTRRFSHAVEKYKSDNGEYVFLNIVHQVDKGDYGI